MKEKSGKGGRREPTQSYGDMQWADVMDYQEYEVKEYEAIAHQTELCTQVMIRLRGRQKSVGRIQNLPLDFEVLIC